MLSLLKKKYKFSYKETFDILLKIVLNIALMLGFLYILRLIINIPNTTRMLSLLNVIIYSLIGATIYIFFTWKMGIIKDVFGDGIILKLKNKFFKSK